MLCREMQGVSFRVAKNWGSYSDNENQIKKKCKVNGNWDSTVVYRDERFQLFGSPFWGSPLKRYLATMIGQR